MIVILVELHCDICFEASKEITEGVGHLFNKDGWARLKGSKEWQAEHSTSSHSRVFMHLCPTCSEEKIAT